MDGPSLLALLLTLGALLLCAIALVVFWIAAVRKPLRLVRESNNPVLSPRAQVWWESEAVFNPAAVVFDGRVHLFYRALGRDGISRVGHASSADGVHFDERSEEPVYDQGAGFTPRPKRTRLSYETLSYSPDRYASGGGWGGVEDPRAVSLDGRIYMSFGLFEGWQCIRLACTSLAHVDFAARRWNWDAHTHLSPDGETHKNWVLFPEKIDGKFAILHALTPTVMIDYVESLEDLHDNPIKSNNRRSGRKGKWDELIRGAGAPPIKTAEGWLLFYHGMNPVSGHGYNVGAMLLDLNDPTRIRYQSDAPVLQPEAWYENDWKPGVVYASGAVVLGDDILVYYGGGDKYVAAARANLRDFLRKLTTHQHATLSTVSLR